MAASDIHRLTRVLHVVRPVVGGMKGHVMQVATGLEAYGFEAEIACPGSSDVVESALAAGLAVHPVPIVGPLNPVQDLEAVLVLADRIRHGSYDLIHVHGFKAGLVGRLAAMLARFPVRILTAHNFDALVDAPEWKKRILVAGEGWLARHTSRIIAVSNAVRRELLEVYGIDPRLVVTVHNGIDLEPYREPVDPGPVRDRYGLPRDALVFGIAARFAPQKQMHVLVEAAVPVLEKVPNAWLLLAGDGPLLEEVRGQASRTPVADRILFPGYETDVRGMLAALDVFVSSARSEGLGLATVEAMAAGLPVVNTEGGGTTEVVIDGETGYLVEPGRTEGLSDAMLRLARDPALRVSMGEAGRARALDVFAEDRMLERTAEVYREVLCSSSPR